MVIKVQCPSCATAFPVDTNKIPEKGVNARCSVCAGVFRVERPAPPVPPAADSSAGESTADAPAGVAPPEPTPPVAAPEPAPPVAAAEPHAGPEPAEEEPAPPAPEQPAESSAHEPPEVESRPPVEADPVPTPVEDGWVIEREDDVDPAGVAYDPVGTLEREMADAGAAPVPADPDAGFEVQETFASDVAGEVKRDEGIVTDPAALEGMDFGGSAASSETSPEAWGPPETDADDTSAADSAGGDAADVPAADPAAAVEPLPEPPAPAQRPAPAVGAFTFGKRDPAERARRLARVLVSDMIMYNPERHERALSSGTLKADFAEEIDKSWKEYVDQIGREMAEGTDHWRAALNDVLAKGQEIF